MKKIIAIICLILSAAILASCTGTLDIYMDNKGYVKLNVRVVMTEDELANAVKSNEAVKYVKFSKETIDGKEFFVHQENMSYKPGDENDVSNPDNGLFDMMQISQKEFLAKVSTEKEYNLMSDIYKYSATAYVKVSFPYEIISTNGKLSDDKKSVTFTVKKGSIIYAATSQSTAKWTKTKNTDSEAKFVVNSRIINFQIKTKYTARKTARIEWNKKTATNFEVFIKQSNGKYKSVKKTTKDYYVIKGLKVGKLSYFYVKATNKYWSEKSFVDGACAIDTSKVTKMLYAGKDKKMVYIAIKYIVGASGYTVYRSKTKDGKFNKIADTYNCEYMKQNMKKGTYYYKVRAFQKTPSKRYYAKISTAKKVVIK